MQTDADATIATAIDWHLRHATMDGAAWADFVTWLEADAMHAAAYDRVAADDRLLEAGAFPPVPEPVVVVRLTPRPAARWAWPVAGAAVAAGLVAVLLPLALPAGSDLYTIRTKAGQQRTLQLADGTRIDLNGGTRMVLDRNDLRVASLSAGQATFHVVHDAAAPFTVRSGDLAIRDLGTVFDVTRDADRTDVQVASGSVMVQPDAEAVMLRPGDTLHVVRNGRRMTRGHVAADTVGGWSRGRLTFSGQPLGDAIQAIERRYEVHVDIAPVLSSQPFTGMVALSGSVERDIPHLAMLVGAKARRDGQQWVITP